jgi:hypothetical protein
VKVRKLLSCPDQRELFIEHNPGKTSAVLFWYFCHF